MAKREWEVQSVFNKWLGMKARQLAKDGVIEIIEAKDFPEGAPIHEDGSTEYDPMKPLVLFAVSLSGRRAINAWNVVLREFDDLRSVARKTLAKATGAAS